MTYSLGITSELDIEELCVVVTPFGPTVVLLDFLCVLILSWLMVPGGETFN